MAIMISLSSLVVAYMYSNPPYHRLITGPSCYPHQGNLASHPPQSEHPIRHPSPLPSSKENKCQLCRNMKKVYHKNKLSPLHPLGFIPKVNAVVHQRGGTRHQKVRSNSRPIIVISRAAPRSCANPKYSLSPHPVTPR